jgi:hypothetical protein
VIGELFPSVSALWTLVVLVSVFALLFVSTPRLVRRVRHGDMTMAERIAAVVLLLGVVAGAALLLTPISDGPYRCSPVVFGSEGRQTVYPDDAPRDEAGPIRLPRVPGTPSTEAAFEAQQGALQRRQNVCDDAARARAVVAAVVIGSSMAIAAGVAYIFRSSSMTSPQGDDRLGLGVDTGAVQ